MTCILAPGGTYSVTAGGTTSYSLSEQVWIDFNSDSTFQASESVGGTAGGYSAPHVFSISIPASGITTGRKRIRVITEYYYHRYPTINPCPDGTSSYYYGEIRDYTVMVGRAFLIPSTLNFGSVATSSTSFGTSTTVLDAAYLTPASGNVTVAASTNFLLCSSSTGTFVNSYTISYTGATITASSVYVKFVAPATSGTYTGTIDVTGGGLTTGFVRANLSGSAVPHCSGTPSSGSAISSLSAAATRDAFTLSDTGYSSGVGGLTFQWQSSPTGTSGWTSMSGATNSTCTISGLTATTYYRCTITCVYSSASSTSGTVSVVYLPPCTGAPTGGTAVATTGTCSGCTSDTIYVTGRTVADSITFQWQRSPDGTAGWTNIVGATNDRYIFAPTGDYRYRLAVVCLRSGLTGYSSVTRIVFPYHFVSHSVSDSTTTACTGPLFSAKANGNSPVLFLKTFYGDGTSDSVAMPGSPMGQISIHHNYAHSGTYSIKHVLYFNNTRQDSVSFGYNYSRCYSLPIRFFHDVNANGIYESTVDRTWKDVIPTELDSNGVPIDTIFARNGFNYVATGAAGTVYEFRPLVSGTPYSIVAPSSGFIKDTILSTVNPYPAKYFALNCVGSAHYSDLSVRAVVPVNGRRDQIGYVYVQNNACDSTSGVLSITFSPRYNSFVSRCSPAPTTVAGTVATYNLSAIGRTETYVCYQTWTPLSAPLSAGDTVHESFMLSCTSCTDVDTSNNTETRVDTVRASSDPNFIQASPAGHILAGTTLRYTVGFENDGNDTAQNIYVLDTLSDLLEERTLKPVFASHDMYVEKVHIGGYTIMKFDFPNIKLLDSTHHGLCDGAFQYDMRVKSGLPDGTIIPARVGIYFDDNEVVMTNEEHNIIGFPSGVREVSAESDFVIYPNPAKDQLTVQMSTAQNVDVVITNSMGAVVLHQSVSHTVNKLDIKNLASGIYYVKLMGEQGSVVKKMVKM